MSNPLLSQFNNNTFKINPELMQLYKTLKGGQNPTAMLSQLAQSNPQIAQIINMCQGQNPQQLFYSLCQQRGINPDDILRQLR